MTFFDVIGLRFALPALALLGGCASLLSADFDRPGEDAGAGVPSEAGSAAACGMACASPPRGTCIDPKNLRAFAPQGTCADGLCGYAQYDVRCTHGCQDGTSTGNDLCNSVTCVAPPPAQCVGTTLTYYGPGVCSAGACSYAPTSTECAQGCRDGACIGAPCTGVLCTSPPSASCANATTRQTYASPGTCSAGKCSYSSTTTACA